MNEIRNVQLEVDSNVGMTEINYIAVMQYVLNPVLSDR